MSDAALQAPDRPARDPFYRIERTWPRESALDRGWIAVEATVQARLAPLRRRALGAIVDAVERESVGLDSLDADSLRARAFGCARTARQSDPAKLAHAATAFALVREAASRHLGLRHHPVQLMGGYAMMRGWLAEMQTGEGKTLTATLAACAMALTGRPVHVITVNDYLAGRDAAEMEPVYHALGLDVGVVVADLSQDRRRAAYARAVTYCSNKELAFDYLRDRLTEGAPDPFAPRLAHLRGVSGTDRPKLLRGLAFALIDEADSVLIDEARTPLILSGEGPPLFDATLLGRAAAMAGQLEQGRDWTLFAAARRIELTEPGRRRLAALCGTGPLANRVLREELAVKALSARHLFRRDEQYLVRDGKVIIIDEYTGRLMPDRFWTDGLHQMVELKEDLAPSRGRVTRARTTYQRFFRRYDRISGMTGTAREVAGELWRVYRLPVTPIPTHRPVRRVMRPALLTRDAASKWSTIAETATRITRTGGAVLIGVRSVATAQACAAALERAGVAHAVLSAAQDAEEARKIGEAGQAGKVTVATNMAGRGADIKLGEGVAAQGGLHVIMSEMHDSARIDRQLAGRAGRQGEPGVFLPILSREDPLLRMDGNRAARLLARAGLPWLARLGHRLAQRQAEALHRRMRRDLLRQDEVMNDAISLAGLPD